MADITTGGLRDRLIRDETSLVVKAGLDALGWFDTDRRHKPLIWRDKPVTESDTVVPLGTITLTFEDMREEEAELGSLLAEERHEAWVDFYAESEAVGRQVIGDVRDILRGKHPSIGRTAPVVPVYDRTLEVVPAEPAFYVAIENVDVDRARETTRPFEEFWFTCSFEVVDVR